MEKGKTQVEPSWVALVEKPQEKVGHRETERKCLMPQTQQAVCCQSVTASAINVKCSLGINSISSLLSNMSYLNGHLLLILSVFILIHRNLHSVDQLCVCVCVPSAVSHNKDKQEHFKDLLLGKQVLCTESVCVCEWEWEWERERKRAVKYVK